MKPPSPVEVLTDVPPSLPGGPRLVQGWRGDWRDGRQVGFLKAGDGQDRKAFVPRPPDPRSFIDKDTWLDRGIVSLELPPHWPWCLICTTDPLRLRARPHLGFSLAACGSLKCCQGSLAPRCDSVRPGLCGD